MSLEAELQKIDERFKLSEGEDRDRTLAIEALKALHLPMLRGDEAVLKSFIQAAIRICGGVYIPYLFWMEIVKFVDQRGDRDLLYEILEAFSSSDFEEAERNKMLPLLAIYFTSEKEFQVDKIKAYIVGKSHKTVQEYFTLLARYIEQNPKSVEYYREKLRILKSYYPNFDLLNLPTSTLREKLGVA